MRAALWYLATRLLGLAPLLWPEAQVLGEPTKWLVQLDREGPARAFPEYPWPAVALLDLPLRLGIPTIVHYYAAVVLFLLAVDAGLTWLLWRAAGRRMSRGLWLWLLVFPALGPLMVTRFDALPAALAAGGLIALAASRPRASGGVLALATGVKLWPAIGLAAFLVPASADSRTRIAGAFAACGAVLAVATAAAAGLPRLWSPFTFQAWRGLQVEALAALPLLWARYQDPGNAWSVRFVDTCGCYELFGPGVDAALAYATVALAAGVLAFAALHVRAFRAPPQGRTAGLAALLMALGVGLWLLTGRAFSPQYMIWLAAPLAVLGALPGMALARLDLALFVAATVLTHLIYPLGYQALIVERHFLQGTVIPIVAARDLLLLVLVARLGAQAWRATASPIPQAA